MKKITLKNNKTGKKITISKKPPLNIRRIAKKKTYNA